MGLMALSVSLAVAEDAGLHVMEAEIVKKETHPVLFRQKREWIWNSLYVEEEKPAPIAYKIGQVGSRQLQQESLFLVYFPGPIFHSLVSKRSVIYLPWQMCIFVTSIQF